MNKSALDKVSEAFRRHAGESRILSIKINPDPGPEDQAYLPRVRLAILCDGGVKRERALEVVTLARESIKGVYRRPDIAVMTTPVSYNRWKGQPIL